jgi:hypothetical protein
MKRATWLIWFSARWPSISTREASLSRANNDRAEERDDCGKPIHITIDGQAGSGKGEA